jgi:hypothetical protein
LSPAARESVALIAMRLSAGMTLDEIAVVVHKEQHRIKFNSAARERRWQPGFGRSAASRVRAGWGHHGPGRAWQRSESEPPERVIVTRPKAAYPRRMRRHRLAWMSVGLVAGLVIAFGISMIESRERVCTSNYGPAPVSVCHTTYWFNH